MCLSVPGKVIAITGNIATIEIAGSQVQAGIHLIEDLQVNDLVLIHSGFVIQKLSREEAEETEQLLREIIQSTKNEKD